MALDDTIRAIDCVRPCDTLREIDDASFYALMIDKLATNLDIPVSSLAGPDLTIAVDDAICELKERNVLPQASPQTLKAILLHYANL
jgi:hypothetical protein